MLQRLAPYLLLLALATRLEAEPRTTATLSLGRTLDGHYYTVEFRARPERVWGHAFVLLRHEHPDGRIEAEAFGAWPAEGYGIFGAVEGLVVDEFWGDQHLRTTHQLEVEVHREQFERIRQLKQVYEAKGRFQCLTEDCLTMVGEEARALGLKTPSRWVALLPQTYVAALIALNAPAHFRLTSSQ